ncbi:MAG: hypothetical protein Kow00120_00370 [Anaerolineae bacterium]
MADIFAGRLATIQTLFAVGARNATVQGNGVDISGLEGDLIVALDSTAGDDADATLDLTIEHRADATDAWAAVPAAALYDPTTGEADTFTQVTNAAASTQQLALKREQLKPEVRAVLTLAGATPEFTCGVYLAGISKYSAAW